MTDQELRDHAVNSDGDIVKVHGRTKADEILISFTDKGNGYGGATCIPKSIEATIAKRLLSEATAAHKKTLEEAYMAGLQQHTWMKDGVTYVGNGTYTLKEAKEMALEEIARIS